MKHFKVLTAAVLALLFFFQLSPTIAHAGTYWVSPTGQATWTQCKSQNDPGNNYCSLATANLSLVAGDTVYLKGGTYMLNAVLQGGVAPRNSGSDINNRITYASAPGETPTIKGSGCYDCGVGIFLEKNNQYIKVDGITFQNLGRWALLINRASYNEIVRCKFFSDTGEDVVMGFYIGSWCPGGSIKTCYSVHNWVHDNTFSKAHRSANDTAACYEGRDLVRIGDPPNSSYGYYEGDDNNNTIENNYMEYAGHALFDTYGTYTVFKNNIMHNEGWITDSSGVKCTYPPMPNGKYGHRLMQISEDFGREGTYDLVENNRMGYSSANPNNPGEAILAIAAPKNIVRFNYLYGGQQAGIYFKYPSYGKIGAGGTGSTNNRVYNNTSFHNGWSYPYMQSSQPSCSTCPGKVAGFTVYSATVGNVIKNNIAYDNFSNYLTGIYKSYTGLDITVDSGKDPADYPQVSVINNWTTTMPNKASTDPQFVNPDLSDPSSRVLPNLELKAGSPAIDQGTFLTQTASAGTNSTVLVVKDALYFQDGTWGSDLVRQLGNFQADWISVGKVGNAVQIAKIDYSTNTITLKSPISWDQDSPVWLFKDSSGRQVLYGGAPDMGAAELIIPPVLEILKGDISGDAKVTAYDAALAAQHAIGLRSLTESQIKAGDLNDNGTVNLDDALLIIKKSVGAGSSSNP